jgi:hypothetical protein
LVDLGTVLSTPTECRSTTMQLASLPFHTLPANLPAAPKVTELESNDPAWTSAFGANRFPQVDLELRPNPDSPIGSVDLRQDASVGRVGFEQALSAAVLASANAYEPDTLTAVLQGRDGAYYLGSVQALPEGDGDVEWYGLTNADVQAVRSADPEVVALADPNGWYDLRSPATS